jgi:nicotinamide phosphoribosyltransferase
MESKEAVLKGYDERIPTPFLILTDGYKYSHPPLYPDGMTNMMSYFEARKGADFPFIIFFGLQYQLLRYLKGTVITKENSKYIKALLADYFGNDKIYQEELVDYIIEHHDGKLPIRIKALPEGSVVPIGTPLMTVESTDEKCAWMVNFIEGLLSHLWASCTVATASRANKNAILKALIESSDLDFPTLNSMALFKLHDFGFRGVTCVEQAEVCGSAHLINFMGTDTMPALKFLMDYYGAEKPAFSIPATEHSTTTTHKFDGEKSFIGRVLEKYPEGYVAMVMDSYDAKTFVKDYAASYKDQILSRNGTVIFRPDSGNPEVMSVQVCQWLDEVFGSTTNSKGFKVLDSHVRMIYGDGIDCVSLPKILAAVLKAGYSAENLAFGSGGGLLQKFTRDTMRMAFKACWCQVGDESRDVYKQPSSDSSKGSKKGRLAVVESQNSPYEIALRPFFPNTWYETVTEDQLNGRKNVLETVFENGVITKYVTLNEIRKRVDSSFNLPE